MTLCPSATVTSVTDSIGTDGSLLITVPAPTPCNTTLWVIVNPPANEPAPILIVDPLAAHANAPAIVANGLLCDANPHTGSEDADEETYSVLPAASADVAPSTVHADDAQESPR